MTRNMHATHDLIFSQRVLLKLIDSGMSREAAYDLVQPLTAQSWNESSSFKELVENCPAITEQLSKEELEDAFDPMYHLRRIDEIYHRVGLD